MPLTDTTAISFGNWIVAFYVVFAMAAVALVTEAAVLIDWTLSKVRASRLTGAKMSRSTQVAQSRA